MTPEMTLGDYVRVFKRRRMVLVIVPLFSLCLSYFYAHSLEERYSTQASIEIQKNVVREGAGFQRAFVSVFEKVTLAKLALNKEVAELAAGHLQKKFHKYAEADTKTLASQIRATVMVSNLENSNILQVSATGNNPTQIAEFCNAYVLAIIDYNRMQQQKGIDDLKQYLIVQNAIYAEKMNVLDDQLMEVRSKGSGRDGPAGTPEALEKVETRLDGIASEEADVTARQKLLSEGMAAKDLEKMLQQISSPDIQRDKIELARKKSELASAEKQYTERHPVVDRLRQEVAAAEQSLMERVFPAAESQKAAMQQMLDKLDIEKGRLRAEQEMIRTAIASLPERLRQEGSIQRELGIVTSVNQMFRQKLEDLEISAKTPADRMVVLDPAPVPHTPIYPNRKFIIGMGISIGAMLSLAFAFLIESLDTSLTAMRDVERFIDKPILAVIPAIQIDLEKIQNSAIPLKKELLEKMPLLVDPRCPSAEAYRTLRAVLNNRFLVAGHKTLLITSSTPQEGKTTTSINLAIACADAGLNTVLVGANMRHPILGRHFEIDRSKGLHDILNGDMTPEEVLQSAGYPNLSIIDSGSFARRPAEILARKEFDDLMLWLKSRFDIVLIDSPPTLPVADTPTMASRVDGILIVYLVSVAPRDALLRCKEMLEEIGGNVVGIVFNDIRGASQDDHAGYYYHHKYAGDEFKRI